ncbi:MAG: thioredoxin [Bacteroidales bacterium]|jgi:thioredoxin 1|nr:thioredoxin [Bacteroidales bacterium]
MKDNITRIIQGDTPVLIDFYATWCSPCRMMSPILEQLKKNMGESIRILKIDVDKNPEMAQKYGIRGVPSLLVFKNGQVRWSGSGVMQADKLAGIIRQFA